MGEEKEREKREERRERDVRERKEGYACARKRSEKRGIDNNMREKKTKRKRQERETGCEGGRESGIDELNGHGAKMHETEVPENVRVRVFVCREKKKDRSGVHMCVCVRQSGK